MCGRYGQTKRTIHDVPVHSPFKKDYELIKDLQDNVNTTVGQTSIIIGKDQHTQQYEYYPAVFGLTPGWAKKPMYWFNARAEGSAGKGEDKITYNQNNDPSYQGPWSIGRTGAFATSFQKHRCLLPVSWFFEGPEVEKLSKPYLIRKKDSSPIFLAGCASKYNDQVTFTIITTPASKLLQRVGHHRSPMIIPEHQLEIYLDHDLPMKEIETLIHPFDSEGYIAYRVSDRLKKTNTALGNNDVSLLEAIDNEVLEVLN